MDLRRVCDLNGIVKSVSSFASEENSVVVVTDPVDANLLEQPPSTVLLTEGKNEPHALDHWLDYSKERILKKNEA
jgi:hypothetical protein